MSPPNVFDKYMTLFGSVTIKVYVTSSLMEPDTQGDLNPYSQALITHIWLRINYLSLPLEL
jgi:hypothetical protein